MLEKILLTFSAFWIALFPVYLWGYGVTLLSDKEWSRARFWLGSILGLFSVGLVFGLDVLIQKGPEYLFGGMIIFLGVLYGGIFLFTSYGSPFARTFLRKIAIVHVVLIFFTTGATVFLSKYFEISLFIPALTMSILLAAIFEESAKHFASIGLIGGDFKFSKQDIILFTFFIALGFVFVENILYFVHGHFSLGEWIFRSFFTLILHVFAAVVCAYFWWRALSYKLFSFGYLGTFLSGFLLASIIHTLYNLFLEKGNIFPVLLLAVMGYIIFTRLLLRDSQS